MPRKRVRVNAAQRQTLAYVRKFLGDRGYLIFPVAPPSRRSEHDFIALLRDAPSNFLRVRPTAGGNVMLQPFSSFVLQKRFRDSLDMSKRKGYCPAPVRWGAKRLTDPGGERWWDTYLTPEAQKECGRLKVHL